MTKDSVTARSHPPLTTQDERAPMDEPLSAVHRRRNANGVANQSFAAIPINIDTVAVERC